MYSFPLYSRYLRKVKSRSDIATLYSFLPYPALLSSYTFFQQFCSKHIVFCPKFFCSPWLSFIPCYWLISSDIYQTTLYSLLSFFPVVSLFTVMLVTLSAIPLLFNQKSSSVICLSYISTNSQATGFYLSLFFDNSDHHLCRSHHLSQAIMLVSSHLGSYGKETSQRAGWSYPLTIQDTAERKWNRFWQSVPTEQEQSNRQSRNFLTTPVFECF